MTIFYILSVEKTFFFLIQRHVYWYVCFNDFGSFKILGEKMPSFYPKNFRFFFRKYYSSHSTHLKLVIELLKFKFAFLSRKKLKNFHIFSSKSKKKQINNCKTSFLKLVFPKNKKQLEKILHKFHREKSNNKKIHGCEIYFFKLNFNHISVVKKTMNIFSDSI